MLHKFKGKATQMGCEHAIRIDVSKKKLSKSLLWGTILIIYMVFLDKGNDEQKVLRPNGIKPRSKMYNQIFVIKYMFKC